MRRVLVLAGVGAVALVAGCHPREIAPGDGAQAVTIKPTTEQLVGYINDNAQTLKSIKTGQVALTCRQGGESVGLTGALVCQKPRNFRLRADLVGKPAVDVGSNDDEFWFWITERAGGGKDNDLAGKVCHCSYTDMADGKARSMPFPFQPDMVLAALGLGECDPNKKYTIKDDDPKTVGLVEETTSAQGQPIKKVTLFSRTKAAPGKPQLVAHLLYDAKGNEICRADVLDVQSVQLDKDSRVFVPSHVHFTWKTQQMDMDIKLYDIEVNKANAPKVFDRRDLSDKPSYNLARGPDAPTGIGKATTPNPIQLIDSRVK
jgi:hypothetical protein